MTVAAANISARRALAAGLAHHVSLLNRLLLPCPPFSHMHITLLPLFAHALLRISLLRTLFTRVLIGLITK